jgi:hypothetical protein
MKKQIPIDSEALAFEIHGYLVAVDVFRAERCEPTWLPEPTPPTSGGKRAPRARGGARPARA